MKKTALSFLLLAAFSLSACALKHIERAQEAAPRPSGFEIPTSEEPAGTIRLDYDFTKGETQSWRADAAFYSDWMDPEIDFTSGLKASPMAPHETAFQLSGANVSVSLFMFVSREIGERETVLPQKMYDVEFRVHFLSAASRDCIGFGGSPGEMLILAGVTSTAPKKSLQGDFWKLVPGPTNDPEVYTTAGDIDNGRPCEPALETFAQVERTTASKIQMQSDREGCLHLIVGTAGGFMGQTQIYLQRIEVRLSPIP